MKKVLYTTLFLLIINVLLSSCTIDRSIAQRMSEFESTTSNENPCFIQKNDGTVVYYTTLKLMTGFFKTPYLLADDNTRIRAGEIRAYQDIDHYFVSQKVIAAGNHSAVAQESLPGFAVRLVKGRVNVYCKKYYNGERAVKQYFLQYGEEGDIRLYTPELMNELLKNDQAALDLFNKNNNTKNFSEKLLATVNQFNTDQLFTKN